MEHKKVVAAIVVLVAIIAGMFIYTGLKKSELNTPPKTETTETKEDAGNFAGITRVDAKHFYEAGTHTIAGEMLMPTPCDLLNWSTRMQESNPEQVTIDFAVINHAEACAQVMTAQRFKVSFDASEAAVIKATLNGKSVELNLIPALEGESPDDFELFIKG